jgi:hypothetical protein
MCNSGVKVIEYYSTKLGAEQVFNRSPSNPYTKYLAYITNANTPP